jgi:hypothetical protein
VNVFDSSAKEEGERVLKSQCIRHATRITLARVSGGSGDAHLRVQHGVIIGQQALDVLAGNE